MRTLICRDLPIQPLVFELGDGICLNQGQLIALPFLSLLGIFIACDVHEHSRVKRLHRQPRAATLSLRLYSPEDEILVL